MILIEHLSFSFGRNWILKDVNLKIKEKEFVFLIGPSGAGKTTLLRILHGSLPVRRGRVIIAGHNLKDLKKRYIPRLRRDVTMVFQDFKLLLDKTVFENISLPLKILGFSNLEIEKKVNALLKLLGLEKKKFQKCGELSGGEQQKVAIGRAVIVKPKVILADEPTGSIDEDAGKRVMDLFKHFNKYGTTIFIATHNFRLVSLIKNCRVIKIKEGKIEVDY